MDQTVGSGRASSRWIRYQTVGSGRGLSSHGSGGGCDEAHFSKTN